MEPYKRVEQALLKGFLSHPTPAMFKMLYIFRQLTLDYPGQPREKNGRFLEGKMNGGLSEGENNNSYKKPKGFSTNHNGEKTLDKAERQRYNKILIGNQTSDGIQITGMSNHAYDRAAQRMLSPGQILDSLKNKPTPSKNDETCVTYDGQGHRTVVNKESGKIVTIMHRRQAK